MITRHIAILLLLLTTILPAQSSHIRHMPYYGQTPATVDTIRSALTTPSSLPPRTGTPSLKIARLATEYGAAFLLARIGGQIGSSYSYRKVEIDPNNGSGTSGLSLGLFAGTQLGSLIGTYFIAGEDNQSASFPISLGGGLAGLTIGAVATHYTGNSNYIFAGSAAGTVIGFNLTRHYLHIDPTRPYLTNRQFLIQMLSGTAGACLGFLTVDAAFRSQFEPADYWEGGPWIGGIVYGTLLGLPLGSTIGVYTAGSLGPTKGSLVITGLGSAVGTLMGGILTYNGAIPWWCMPVFPAFGAMAGFNATRHYKQDRIPAQLPAPVGTARTYQSMPLFARQVAAGILGGCIGFIGTVCTATLVNINRQPGIGEALVTLYVGAAVGVPVGCTLFVHRVNPVCSGAPAFLLTGAGSVVGLLGANVLNHRYIPSAAAYPVLAALGATVANHLARLSGICSSATAISATPYLAMQHGTPMLGIHFVLL